jgi:hypothetical protein
MAFPRSDEQVTLLSSEFQKTMDGSFAWESAVSAYLGLPALRGFWPMSLVGSSGESNDLSGNGLNLTNNNTARFTVQGGSIPAVILSSDQSEYFSRADSADFDISGAETYVFGNYRGLTFGCWYRPETLAATQTLISKYEAVNQRAYRLYVDAGGNPWVDVSSTGSNQYQKEFTASAMSTLEWHFIAGRFDPGTSLDIWLDVEYESNVAAIPASINNSNESFKIGAQDNTPTNFVDGRMSMVFLCAAYLPDAVIKRLYSRTRSLFQSRDIWQE